MENENDYRHDVANVGEPSLDELDMGAGTCGSIDLVGKEEVILALEFKKLSGDVENID